MPKGFSLNNLLKVLKIRKDQNIFMGMKMRKTTLSTPPLRAN